jgi:hypothetical protein
MAQSASKASEQVASRIPQPPLLKGEKEIPGVSPPLLKGEQKDFAVPPPLEKGAGEISFHIGWRSTPQPAFYEVVRGFREKKRKEVHGGFAAVGVSGGRTVGRLIRR